MELVLQQKQTLNLVMTAELRQAINLLQYSTYDLYQFIKEQQDENPLIELIEQDESPFSSTSRLQRTGNHTTETVDPFLFVHDETETLHDHLLEQVNVLKIDNKTRQIVTYLIQNIDENGYLKVDVTNLPHELQATDELIQSSTKLIQQLEPIGVGARNLAECLSIQAKHLYPEDQLLINLVKHHLTELANRQWEILAEQYDVTLNNIQQAFTKIQSLNPKPGASFSTEEIDYVEPDIIIRKVDDKFTVHLNDDYIPEIRLSEDYLPYLNSHCELSSYVKEQYNKIYWLKRSIEKRRQTILKITQVIIERQLPFFEYGFKRLQPLTLKDVAKAIGMHESTVSRATMNKVIQTPKGTFDMRRLFSTKINRSDGSATSQTKVKMLIKDLIKRENKQKPLSDKKIADHLKKKNGIKISRRTVAKYRNQLKIPSSRQRREVIDSKN